MSNLKHVPGEMEYAPLKITNANVVDTVGEAELAENEDVAAILYGDGEYRLSAESHFGSRSLGSAVSG